MTTLVPMSAAPRLRVRDVHQAARWYHEALGFEIGEYYTFENGEPGFVIVERKPVRIQLTRAPENEPTANPEGTTNPGGVYIYARNIDALYRELKQRDVRFLYDLEEFPYGMREFAIVDCDGHYVGFGEPV